MKAKLLKPGMTRMFVDYSAVKFPVKVTAKRIKNRLGEVCAFRVTQQEIQRIGGIIRNPADVGTDDFLFSITLGEAE